MNDTEIRFWDKVEIADEDDCWLWLGSIDTFGYGLFRVNNKLWKAHRYSYQLHKGLIGNLCVLHTCDNPRCVNSNHLFLGTKVDNSQDRDKKDRGCLPYQVGKSRKLVLSNEQVKEIRIKYASGDYTYRELVDKYHVSFCPIYNAINYKGGYGHPVL